MTPRIGGSQRHQVFSIGKRPEFCVAHPVAKVCTRDRNAEGSMPGMSHVPHPAIVSRCDINPNAPNRYLQPRAFNG
jgi:hypothetical protein